MRKGYLIAAALYMAAIFVLSAQPGDSELMPPLPYNLDKAAHAALYGGLGFLLAKGLGSGRRGVVLGTVLAALYGLTDEWHQTAVAGREASFWDWASDGVGGLLGALVGVKLPRRNGEPASGARDS